MTSFDAATVQIDAVLAEQLDIELIGEAGALRVFGENSLDMGEGDFRGNLIDGAEPGQRFLDSVLLTEGKRQAKVLDSMAAWAQRDQPTKGLDAKAVVVVPHLVAFDGVRGPYAVAYLAPPPGGHEGHLLQSPPGRGGDVGTDVLIPAAAGDELYAQR